jgi:hypothetical protein
MRVLVDEGMPVQVLPPLRLNKSHEFDHIDELKWAATMSCFRSPTTTG